MTALFGRSRSLGTSSKNNMKDLSPQFDLPSAEQEVAVPTPVSEAGTQPIGGFMAGPNGMIAKHGDIRSANYEENESGWRLGPDDAEFNVGTFSIGGTVITIDNTEDVQD